MVDKDPLFSNIVSTTTPRNATENQNLPEQTARDVSRNTFHFLCVYAVWPCAHVITNIPVKGKVQTRHFMT